MTIVCKGSRSLGTACGSCSRCRDVALQGIQAMSALIGDYRTMGTKPTKRIGVSVIDVTPDEAVEAMVHHLRLAAKFFEAAPEDFAATKSEMLRIMKDQSTNDNDNSESAAGVAWLAAIDKYFEGLKKDD